MVKRLLIITIALFFFQISEAFSQISIGTVDAGPYTPGSSIAATFSIGPTDCIAQNNVFELILVSPTNVETTIGSYTGFYAAFVNGTIPAGTAAGAGYRLKVRSTNPVLETGLSTPFTVSPLTTPVVASVSTTTISTNPVTFGRCNSSTSDYFFTNTSTTGNVTATLTNQLKPTPSAPAETPNTLSFAGINEVKPFTPRLAHYTVFVKAQAPDGTVGTRAYFLVNNRAVTAFVTTGSETVCFPTGTFEYAVTVDGDNSIGENFPGNVYRITWGDGTETVYTYCDIVKLNNKVSHSYDRSSCGVSNGSIFNAFQITVQVVSQFPNCGPIGSPLFANARVVGRPINEFDYPAIVCLGDQANFVNESIAGDRPNSTSNGCTDNEVTYTWWVDGMPIAGAIEVSRDFIFRYTFPTKGNHIVRLTSNSDGECQALPVEYTVCVQDTPRPAFTLSSNLVCLSSPTINANSSTSILDNTCPNTPVYTWSVNPSPGVTFNRNAVNPDFTFTQPGIYDIILSIQSGTCSVPTAAQRVVVNSPPQATLSADINLCARGDYTFAPNGSVTNTTVSGTTEALADTYTWTVTGGAYTFVSPSTANSQYPVINFQDFSTYTVTLTHKNNCSTVSDSQTLIFTPSPTASITANPAAICYNNNINLTGVIANPTPSTTFEWLGAGTFSPADLITTYTPTAAERTAGVANIRLRVLTGITGTCSEIFANISVTIYPNNIGTNPIASRSQNICSGDAAIFNPTSSVSNSTFRWTAVNTSGSASGFSASGTGNINQTLTNNNTTQPAVVEYTIIPEANGCDGEPFVFTVTINPRPILTATPAAATICSGQFAGISLSVTNTPVPTRYTWTSSSLNGVTGGSNNPTAPSAITAINETLTNTGTAQGTITYNITPYSATGCPGTPVTVTINVDPALTPPNAGVDRSICATNSYTLEGNTATVGTGTWTLTSGNGPVSFVDEHLATTAVNGLVAGRTYTFRWTIDAASTCAPRFDEVTITVNEPTIPGTTAGNPTTVCSGTNNGTITLSGNTGSVIGWESSLDGTNWNPAFNSTTTTTYTFNNLTVPTYYRAIVQNGGCTIERSTATMIAVSPASTIANAGPDQILCNETTAPLTGIAPATGETGRWTIPAGAPSATFADETSPTTTVINLIAGQTYRFIWTITGNAPCGPTSDEVQITNNPLINQSISSTVNVVCSGQDVLLNGNVPTGGDGTYVYAWEIQVNGGAWQPQLSDGDEEDLVITLTTQGTVRFRRIVTSGGCTSTSNEYEILVRPAIAGNSISADQIICSGSTPALLTGPAPTGGDGSFTYQWQSSADGTTWANIIGANAIDYQPPVLTATTFYRRGASTAACGSLFTFSNSVRITVNPNAEAEFRWTSDIGCFPFSLPITVVEYADRNATYTWFADNVQIGTGSSFPGYTITGSNQSVTIKLVVTSSLGCAVDEFEHVFSTNQAVPASFTQNTTQGCGPLSVTFVNTSNLNAGATFRWNFGNGQTSNDTNPSTVTFQPDLSGKDTTYVVTLYSITSCGTDSAKVNILVKSPPRPVFSPSTTSGCSPLTVDFTNNSPVQTGITYTFNFGDGTAPVQTTDKSTVTHIYRTTTTVRTFNATLTAVNECGTVTTTPYTIIVRPNTVNAELVVNGNQLVDCAPHTVTFDNNTTGATSFTVDFGDGTQPRTSIISPERFQYTFTRSGTYKVLLTATNGCSTDTTSETITVRAQPLTEFDADNKLGCTGLAVKFINNTQNAVSYLWDFGDGTTSTEFEPTHTYSGTQEYYTVTLTATNNLGCPMTVAKTNFIHIVQPPVAAFNVDPSTLISIPDYTFNFQDESTNNPTIWEWDFGDGTGSALRNPSHTYLDTGTYRVTLKTINQQGCFTTTFKNVTIKGVPGYLFVPNSFIPGDTRPELREFRAKGSGMASWRFSVFNKWGQLLWETTKLDEGRPAEGWDGTYKGQPMPQGVYFWKIDVQMVNETEWKGMTYDKSVPKRTGPIHLIR